MEKRALIAGITGQDGAYLAEFLLNKGYKVYGIVRRSSSFNRSRIEHLYLYDESRFKNKVELLYGDLNDASSLNRIIEKVRPDEIYNLAAQSHVGISFKVPEYTAEITGLGTTRLIDAIREVGVKSKFYQASSSEMFGNSECPQNENTPFMPQSPYACAKVYSYYITKNYREAYNMFICNGILFNHESPLRGENFVTRKITLSLARIKYGLQDVLELGNLSAKRDWGYAKDYVQAMWLMLQQDEPDDYVVATGETRSVREFTETAANEIGIKLIWKGENENEVGIDSATGKEIVVINPDYYRPTDVNLLLGDPGKAVRKLGWNPRNTSFEDLVKIMVKSDLELARKEALIKGKTGELSHHV
ncbi:GDP-mannose 4,6-dehydratase [Candidatus Margulisiibacteriota bacterium]